MLTAFSLTEAMKTADRCDVDLVLQNVKPIRLFAFAGLRPLLR